MPPTSRSRTPPDIKWLLNERAALAGAYARAVARQLELREKCERLEQELSRLQRQIEGAVASANRTQASLDALDATMGLIDTRLEPTAAGEVNAWAGKYGKRGALGAFIEQALRQASPEPLTMTILLNLVAKQFELTLTTPSDRQSLRKSVTSALRALLKRGCIEPLHSRESGSHGLWRWKSQVPSFEALVRQQTELA